MSYFVVNTAPNTGSWSNSGTNSVGTKVQFSESIIISVVEFTLGMGGTGASCTVGLQIWDSTGTVVAQSNVQTVSSSSAQAFGFNLNTPLAVVAGSTYTIGFTVTNNSGTPLMYDAGAGQTGNATFTGNDPGPLTLTILGGTYSSYWATGTNAPSTGVNNTPLWMYITYTVNTPPNAPTFVNMTSSGGSYKSPHIFLSVSDPDTGNTIVDARVQVATDSGFTNLVADDVYSTSPSRYTGLPTATNTATTVTYLNPNPNPAGTLYARAMAKDNNGSWGAWSATQQFTVFAVPWNDTPNGNGFKAQWLNDIATCITHLNQFRGWNPFTYTDGLALTNSSDAKAKHLIERRMILKEFAFDFNTASAPSWTDPDLTNLALTDVSTGGWLSGGVANFNLYSVNAGTLTKALDQTTYNCGGASCKITSSYAGSQSVAVYMAPFSGIVAGDLYSCQATVKAPQGTTGSMVITWCDTNGNRLSSNGSSSVVNFTASGGWDTPTLTEQVAPTGAVKAYFEVDFTMTNGMSVWWDSCWMVQGNPFQLDRKSAHITDLRNYITQV